MANIQVRDVPDPVHRELARRARQAGKSLQQYLAEQLEELASRPTLDDVLDRIERRSKGRLSGADAVSAVQSERARR